MNTGVTDMQYSEKRKVLKLARRKIYAVDLFCGAGGLTHGLSLAGINVRLGVDIDPSCEYPYIANNKSKFLLKPVEDLSAKDIQPHYRKNSLRLLAGCAPCQTFSTYNPKANKSDSRWWLLLHFLRLAKELSPELITMENVPGLMKHEVFKEFVNSLEKNKYCVSFQVVDCSNYGVPQQRDRLVLLASKLGPIKLLSPSELNVRRLTVRDAIGNLREISAGSADINDPLHTSSILSPINLKRIRVSRPGGTWRDWDQELIAECHKRETGQTYGSVYGRMDWDEPSPTITTQFYGFGNGRFGHPVQDRALSLREGAILQSFPKNYKFVPSGKMMIIKSIGRMIGNAVPVKLGEVIGLSIRAHVANHERETRKNRSGLHG